MAKEWIHRVGDRVLVPQSKMTERSFFGTVTRVGAKWRGLRSLDVRHDEDEGIRF